MTIKIETEKTVSKDGIVGRIIKSVEGVISITDLPKKYISGPYFSNMDDAIDFRGGWEIPTYDLRIGRFIDETQFQETLIAIKVAGQRLHDINAEIRKKKESWKGTETILI